VRVLKACAVTRLAVVHRRLPDGQAVHKCRPRAIGRCLARRGPKWRPWTDHVEVHTALARGVGLPVTAGDWTARGKMSTGSIHGPRRTCLTQSEALNRSKEGG
jgi:hypothetical protein